MRELRLVLFFVVGLSLGGGSVFALAATATASGMRFDFKVKAPADVPVSASYDAFVPGTDWTYDPYSSPDATVRNSVNAKIGGKSAAMSAARTIAGSSLARIAVGLAKVGGPVQLGMSLAPLVWNAVSNQWETPVQYQEDKEWRDTHRMWDVWYSSKQAAADNYIEYRRTNCQKSNPAYLCEYTWRWTTGNAGVIEKTVSGTVYFDRNISVEGRTPVVVATPTPSTDQEIQDQIYVQLVGNGMGSDLARRLVAAGYVPDLTGAAGHVQMSGPASIAGDTSTSTSSGPAGMTSTTTTNNYNISYAGDTVTVTTNSSVTTTAPDGSQTTTTTGTTPSGEDSGSAPAPEQPKPFCEENPDSIACQSMDVPAEVKPDPLEKTFIITPTGGFGGAGSCPADASLTFLGQPLSWSFKPACDFFSGVRPAVVAMAWVAAILIALGGYRKGD